MSMHVLLSIFFTVAVIIGSVVCLAVAQSVLEEADLWISHHRIAGRIVTATLLLLGLIGGSIIAYGVYEWTSGLVR